MFGGRHNYSTQGTDIFALPRYNLSASQNNVVFREAKLYNSLPFSINFSHTMPRFRPRTTISQYVQT